jgi:hypothetical protein
MREDKTFEYTQIFSILLDGYNLWNNEAVHVEFSETAYHKFMYKTGMKWFCMLT